MGLLDFAKGAVDAVGDVAGNVGEAVGGDWVVDQAKKAPQATRNTLQASANLSRGVRHLATNPTQVARGVGAAAQFVEDNPGKTWDTGFEISRAVVKDQLDPVNLAINVALVGATIATGGAAAPALAAKLAMGARTARVGLQAAKAGESAVTAMRTTRAANTALRAARAVETADDVVDAAKTAKTLSRMDAYLGGTKRVPNAAGTYDPSRSSRILHPISRRVEDVVQPVRDRAATRILAGGGEQAGAVRQVAAATVQGNTGRMPVQLARQSDRAHALNTTMWRGRQIAAKTVGRVAAAQSAQTAYDIAYNPLGFAEDRAREGWAEHGGEITTEANRFAGEHATEIDQVQGQVQGQAQDRAAQQVQQHRAEDNERAAEEDSSYEPYQQQSPAEMRVSNWRLQQSGRTRSTKTSHRPTSTIGTAVDDSTMPSRIGPSNWYGPQNSYRSGRGFDNKDRPGQPLERSGRR